MSDQQGKRNPDELGALWLKTGRNGKKFMSGTVEGVGAIVVFKNESKSSDKHPDYRILRSQPREERPADDDPFVG